MNDRDGWCVAVLVLLVVNLAICAYLLALVLAP